MDNTQVYFVLTDTGSLLTQTIKLITKKKYNHCSLAFDSNLENTYSFGRKKITNPFIGGFVHEDTLSNFFLQSRCAIYSLRVTQKEKEQLEDFIAYMESNKNRFHYNFLGLFAAYFEVEWNRPDHYFCSQFVATTLNKAGLYESDKALSLITPEDVLNALPFDLVYEGLLANYRQEFTSEARWLLSPSILD